MTSYKSAERRRYVILQKAPEALLNIYTKSLRLQVLEDILAAQVIMDLRCVWDKSSLCEYLSIYISRTLHSVTIACRVCV